MDVWASVARTVGKSAMVEIPISAETARAIIDAGSFAVLVDPSGQKVGKVAPFAESQRGPIGMTEEHIAELRRRIAEDDGVRYTWAEVKEHLQSLVKE
jgi:hypothetical protein